MFRRADLTPIPTALDFRCESVSRGTSFLGVVIGPLVPVVTHTLKGHSKPCLHFATEGKLRCWCQERALERRPVAYLPVMNADREKLVVILSAVAGYRIREVKEGTLLRFTRPDKQKVRINVTAVTGAETGSQWVTLAQKTKGVDIMEYLCHLWQIHSLTKHLGYEVRRALKTDATVELDPNDSAPRYVSWIEKLASESTTSAEAA